ncbi:hypothetical protein JM946_04975 [Steroidobacter sp. S1-65]|uniref:Uncharacterized protein n=1 Tax=Steroidobacter gossypii TaxID=2805490 RepID=A0ABS1WSX2_9GAMM|nr:hypothetical protein [Steroidobacter gossypii]MBM0104083.1 hypothetical protein [Steroidobacter gossypii]
MNLSGLRRSDVAIGNPLLKETPADAVADGALANFEWLQSTGYRDGVLLLGGTAIVDFRMRVAQSELRHDLLPSFWSTCGLLIDGQTMMTARVDAISDSSARVERNGLEAVALDAASRYGSPMFYPNIAILQFTEDHAAIKEHVARIGQERNIVDLLAQVVAWLGYCWAVGGSGNPLMQGHGIPSATLLERAHGLAGIDLSPGLPSASSCPEAIWQAARWWYKAYDPVEPSAASTSQETAFTPRGAYLIRQPAAAAIGIRDDMQRDQIVRTTRGDALIEGLRRRGDTESPPRTTGAKRRPAAKKK